MVFCWRILLDTLMQFFFMLRHLVAEISSSKFDDYRVIHTGASDLKLFWAVYIVRKIGVLCNNWYLRNETELQQNSNKG